MARGDDELYTALEQLNILDFELHRRQPHLTKCKDMYDGKHPLAYASEQYREWFGNQFEGFADNWCMPVSDALSERQRVVGVRPRGDKSVSEELRRWWEESGAAEDAPLAFSTKAVTGRAFALVWGSDDGGPEVTFEDPSQAIVAYEPGSRRRRKVGMKMWTDTWSGHDFATLYTPDHLWKFRRRSARRADQAGGLDGSGGGLQLPASMLMRGGWEQRQDPGDDTWPIPNPLGAVPLVELQNKPKLLGDPISEIDGVIAMQNAINALWAFLFTAADFTALPQRVLLGAELPMIPVLNEEGQKIGEKPIDLPEANVKRILNLEGPNAKIDQWDPADLAVFTGVIEKAANHIGNQTRTPLYYFASSIQNISGDTLKALETGLISKVGERQEVDNGSVKEIHRLMAIAGGNPGLAGKIAGGTTIWKDHESRSESQKVDAIGKLFDVGFPFEYLAEKYTGGDADEVARILRMKEREAEMEPLSIMARRDQTGQPTGRPEPGTRPQQRPAAPAGDDG